MRLQRKENIKNCTKTLFGQAVNYTPILTLRYVLGT
jgi:hypothetical protein